MALSADRNTLAKTQGVLNTYKVKASTLIYAGALVAEVAGYLVPASDTAALVVVGRADQKADNSAGADGAISCKVQEGVFKWDNNGSDPVVAADIGKAVYVFDDHTVDHAGGSHTIKAGVALQIDADGGIWVKTAPNGGL